MWGATVLGGQFQGLTLRKLHENLVQKVGKKAENFGQTSLQEIFFPKFLSPQKLNEMLGKAEPAISINTLRVKGDTA